LHDTADLETRGIPAVFIATTEFAEAASAQARALGADPAGIFVAHPIQDRTDDELKELAEEALEAIVGALVEEG
jgi:alkanesulfonate monooxygenase SsuD/methylene tetrahydromethanopterin reductase-like flavin-dependent oxidoreductase (luciferase family)